MNRNSIDGREDRRSHGQLDANKSPQDLGRPPKRVGYWVARLFCSTILIGLVLNIFLSANWAWGIAGIYFLWIGFGLILRAINMAINPWNGTNNKIWAIRIRLLSAAIKPCKMIHIMFGLGIIKVPLCNQWGGWRRLWTALIRP